MDETEVVQHKCKLEREKPQIFTPWSMHSLHQLAKGSTHLFHHVMPTKVITSQFAIKHTIFS